MRIALVGFILVAVASCDFEVHVVADSADSTFAEMQLRGRAAMGVDQYTSAHQFDSTATGGRIALQRDSTDSVGVATIRAHLRDVAAAFSKGDFNVPGFVHDQTVPGTAVMTAKRDAIRYTFRELVGGGEVVITTTDASALTAVHDFLRFQRTAHHAEGGAHKHGG